MVRAAAAELETLGTVRAVSAVHLTPALGPAGRSFANSAVLLASPSSPADLLAALKRIERAFGRRGGKRWGARVLDLDIILWSGGSVRRRALAVPHPALAGRAFVLAPLAEVAPDWPGPASGRRVRHLLARLTRPRPLPRSRVVGP